MHNSTARQLRQRHCAPHRVRIKRDGRACEESVSTHDGKLLLDLAMLLNFYEDDRGDITVLFEPCQVVRSSRYVVRSLSVVILPTSLSPLVSISDKLAEF